MSFDFYCEETAGGDGFRAKGAGLAYVYDREKSTLDIFHLEQNVPLFMIDMGTALPCNPELFIRYTEKSSQIYALMYSSYQTINLCETVSLKKLTPIVKNITELALMAHFLKINDYSSFGEKITKRYDIKDFSIEVRKCQCKQLTASCKSTYIACLETRNGNKISAWSNNLHSALSRISEKTVRDLITVELLGNDRCSATTLLSLSARLNTISRILDNEFIPNDKLSFKAGKEPFTGTYLQ